jgi:aminobenzoyl-glutamate utilization protein B
MEPKQRALQVIDQNAEQIADVGDSVWNFAEIGMQEYETHDLLVKVLSQEGFRIDPIEGFPTAVMATYGSGKPVIAVHTEFDAVPSGSQAAGVADRRQPVVEGAPGHAEGHNTNAAVMVGAAIAAKRVLDEFGLKGTIKLFGTPAEEQLLARPYFVRDGYLRGVDAAFHPHVGGELSTSWGIRQYANMSVEYTFHGRTAHGANPWLARNALDGAKLMSVGWDAQRQYIQPSARSHTVITDGGVQPNVIPEIATIWFYFRDIDCDGVLAMYNRAKNVSQGAALMTGTTVTENVLSAGWPTRDNITMAEIVQKNIELVGMPRWTPEEVDLALKVQKIGTVPEIGLETRLFPLKKAVQGASTNDSGDICWTVPHGRVRFPANVSGIRGHHWTAAIATATSIAHKGTVAGAKVLAASMVDLFTNPELLEKAKKTFAEEMAGTEYKTLLPPGQKPPVNLNKDTMAKYRPLMKPFYLRKEIRFV